MPKPFAGRTTRAFRRTIAATGAACALLAVVPGVASAASHEYCFWSGSYSSNSAGDPCYAQGTNFLTNNHAYLPYAPNNPTIFCGAHDASGNQYAAFTAGNPSCDHAYSGRNLLKAVEYVDISATTHGNIYW